MGDNTINQTKTNKNKNKSNKKNDKDSNDTVILLILFVIVIAIVIYLRVSKRNKKRFTHKLIQGGKKHPVINKRVKFDLRHNTRVLFNKKDKPIDLLNKYKK